MRALHISRQALAIGISFWIAAAACILGCLPMFAHSIERSPALCDRNAANAPDSDCCHHHSSPANGDHSRHSASCCTPDATVTPAQKWQGASLIAFAGIQGIDAAILADSPLSFAVCDRSFAFSQSPATSGRALLRKAHVLRI